MRVESGPAKADRNWWLLRAALCVGFTLYFLYDGAIGYNNKIRAEAEKKLLGPPFNGQFSYDSLPERPQKPDYEQLLRRLESASREGTAVRAAELTELVGEPTQRESTGPGREVRYYASRYGYLTIELAGDRIAGPVTWHDWKESFTREKVQEQFYWALVPGIPALYCIYRLYKAATLRVVVDERGMNYGGTFIPAENMVSLRDYSPKGWVDLYYTVGAPVGAGDAPQKRLRIDNEKVLRFDEVVDALCALKGFSNPVREFERRKAEEQAEREADDAAAAAAEERAQRGE